MKKILCLLSFLVLTPLSPRAFAHEDHDMDSFNLENTFRVLQAATELEPQEEAPLGSAVPVLTVSGKKIVMNSHFWELVRAWVRIYHQEVRRDCEDCVDFNEDELLSQAKDMARQGFFSTKVLSPFSHAAEHITLETADIGARLGNVALVTKVASELAETVLSKAVGGGGVHVLCNIIDAVILFGTRHLQVAARLPVWGVRLGAGNFGMGLRYWLVSRAVRRAQKRVTFVTGPMELDQETLALVDGEGPSAKRWWNSIDQGKRSLWLNWLKKKTDASYRDLEQVNAQLEKDPGDRELKKQKSRLEKKIYNYAQLKRKNFLGTRYKRFFYLKARRGKTQLKGKAPIESGLNKDVFWILSVQENVLNRALIPQGDQKIAAAFQVKELKSPLSEDEVLVGLAEEAVRNAPEQERADRLQLVKGLLTDVEFVFDPSQPRAERYLQTEVIENTLAQFVYQLIQWKMDTLPEAEGGWLSRLWQTSKLRWSSGQFARYVYEYTDFLRLAAATNSEVFRERYKYEAMETLLRIFKHLENLKGILDQNLPPNQLFTPLSEANQSLKTFKPWQEKKTSYSWIPLRRVYPRCEALWESVR
jgi:hypothetical protein